MTLDEIKARFYILTEEEYTPITEIAAHPDFRGVHYARIERAVEKLVEEGYLYYKAEGHEVCLQLDYSLV